MRILCCLLLASCLLPASDLYVQWSLRDPQGWEKVQDWGKTPKLPDPESVNSSKCCFANLKGWISAIRIGDEIISGFDHYRVEKSVGKIKITAWQNDHGGRGPFFRSALVMTFPGGTVCFGKPGCNPWSSFVSPPDDAQTRHGIWIGNPLWEAHKRLWR
jgi:hypothetical protein